MVREMRERVGESDHLESLKIVFILTSIYYKEIDGWSSSRALNERRIAQ